MSHLSLSSTDCPSSLAAALATGFFVGPSTETESCSLTFVLLDVVLLTTGELFDTTEDVFTLLNGFAAPVNCDWLIQWA